MTPTPPSPPAGPADVAALERQPFFRRTVRKRNALLALALALNLLGLALLMALHIDTTPEPDSVPVLGYHVRLVFDSWHTYFWLAVAIAVQLWLSYRVLAKSLSGDGMTQLYPEDQSGGRTYGGLTGKQIADAVHDLAARMRAGRVSRVVVHDRPDPNAYTAYIPGVGNVVVLHTNILEIMPPEGVRAVIAHELGHVRRRDSLVMMLANVPRLFILPLGVIVLAKAGFGVFAFDGLGVLVLRVLFVALFWVAARWLLRRLQRLANFAQRQGEHLADAYAAQACGWGPTLNALLLMGERAEAIHAVLKALSKQPHVQASGLNTESLLRVLRRLPARELDHGRAGEAAVRLYIEERLAEMRETLCVPLTDEEIADLARRADGDLRRKQADEAKADEAKAKRQEEERAKEAELEKLLLDWRKFDRDHSGHLDPAETAALVAELRADEDRMIFRQFLEPGARWQSHPTMRHRLLFLYDAFREIAPAEATKV
jgi:Zn-dependent protease with chaperone function